MSQVFSISDEHPPRAGLTISSPLVRGEDGSLTAFSLGAGTDITPESYDQPVLYYALSGSGTFLVGAPGRPVSLAAGELLAVAAGMPCGMETQDGLVYLEAMAREDVRMNEAIKAGEALKLAELVPYEAGSIVNMDIASNDAMKFVVMAFDEGTGLSPHRAPGDALVLALEGEATIGYEGEDHKLVAGQSFRFDKGGLHSVTANGRFKMALLIVLK